MVEGSSWFQKRGGRQRVAGAQVGAEAGVVEGKPGAPQGLAVLASPGLVRDFAPGAVQKDHLVHLQGDPAA